MKTAIRGALFTLLLAAISVELAFAGDLSDDIHIQADYAAYRMDDDTARAYVEIFYNIPRAQLDYKPDTDGYVAIIDFAIWLMDSADTVIDSTFWKAGSRIENLSVLENSDYLIADMVTEVFSAGSYNIKLEAANGKRKGSSKFKMDIPVFGRDKLTLSSLQLAYEITPDTTGKFSKAGFRVLPNPSGYFSQDKNVVYIYAEAYNLDASDDSDSMYSANIEIYDSKGKLFKTIPEAKYEKPGSTAVIMTGFSSATLPRGYYSVHFSLKDGETIAYAEKKFAVVASRERLKQEMLQAILSEFPEASKLDNEEDIARFRQDITFIATQDELKLYDSLNLEGKRNYQRDFWQKRDPDPKTPENEFKLEHYRRIKYCDEQFGQYKGVIRGWQTDMGRIYILYGEPSEIEHNQSSIEERNWQQWWYHGLEGGVYFVFVDFEDTGAYSLVHSSKQDEVKDYNWEDKVKMTLFQR